MNWLCLGQVVTLEASYNQAVRRYDYTREVWANVVVTYWRLRQ